MSKTPSKPVTPIRPADVARIQRVVAKQHGGEVPKGNYVGRMQRVIAVAPPAEKLVNQQTPKAATTQGNDNRSKQLNPNHDAYWRARGETDRPDNWLVRRGV
jgi:hypothetical protein